MSMNEQLLARAQRWLKAKAFDLKGARRANPDDELDFLIFDLHQALRRADEDRADQDAALRDAIRETASIADDLAFWKYQAIAHRASVLRQGGALAEPEESPLWKQAERQLLAARRAENADRVAHAEAPRDPGGT